jgi:hypothetical protein
VLNDEEKYCIIMIGAAITDMMNGGVARGIPTIVLGLMAASVAYGRCSS